MLNDVGIRKHVIKEKEMSPKKIILMMIIAFLLSSCAPLIKQVEFKPLKIQNSNEAIIIRPLARELSEHLFAVQIYIFNKTSEAIDLNLDSIQLVDSKSVVLKKLTPEEVSRVVITDPEKEGYQSDNVALKNSRILPGTAVVGKVFWFKYFKFPVHLHIAIGQNYYQCEFKTTGTLSQNEPRSQEPNTVHPSSTTGSFAFGSDGNAFLEQCNAAVSGIDRQQVVPGAQARNAASCLGYLDGVLESAVAPNKERFLCIPENVPTIQAARIVVKYLQGNPQRLHEDRKTLVVNALQQAFPCK
jgi:hypothetical protein